MAGEPITACEAAASYGVWLHFLPAVLASLGPGLGFSEPTQAIFDGKAGAPEREVLGRLLSAWQGQGLLDRTFAPELIANDE